MLAWPAMPSALYPGEGDARLHRLGLRIMSAAEAPEVHAGAIRVSKRLHASGARTIGLLPVGVDSAVPGVALQLGASLVDLLGASIALVDTSARWPAFADLPQGPDPGPGGPPFSIHWLRSSLALLRPRGAPGTSTGVAELEAAASGAGSAFAHLLIDLTGFESLGLHLDAVRLVDRVIVIARASTSTDWALVRMCRQIPAWKDLGVLLVG